MKKSIKKKRGPKPEVLKIQGDWRSAMNKTLKKQRPKKGWPTINKGKPDK